MNRTEERNFFQADLRKFRRSTFERKQMSTTIKRIALVAVASLGLGVLATAPSNAAPTFTYTTIGDSTAGQALVGGQAVVTLQPDTNTSTIVAVSGVGAVVAVSADAGSPQIVRVGTSLVQWSESSTVNGNTIITAAGQRSITLTSSVAGVTTITATPLGADGSPGTAVTKTVTWTSALAKNSVDHSLAYVQAENASVTTSSVVVADSSTADLTFAGALSSGAAVLKARVWVKQFSASDTSTVSTVATGKGADIKVEISGAGTLGSTPSAATGPSLSVLGTSSTVNVANVFYVYSDGRTGPATITITSGTTVITKTLKFTGTAKSYAQNADNSLSAAQIGVGETATVGIDSFDANGNKVASLVTLTASNETATVATIAAINADGLYTITGVATGTARFKLTDGTYSTYVSINVTKKTIASYTLAFDKSSYAPGEKVTWTITAKDSNGKPVADGARALFGAVSTNLSVSNGTMIPTSPSFVDGVATSYFYAPAAASGRFDVTVSQGAADDVRIAALAAATAASATAPTAVKSVYGFDIVNASADAATDAANEATDAANAATDAALAAADAADAATAAAQDASDAVAALSATVAKLVASLKAQITSLTNLVIKIQKKVKA
jgi:hypothetical protein